MKFQRNVWIVSLVSLCNDLASEMLYPIMPIFLRSIGFHAAWLGVIEGLAEAISGLSKGYFGKLSDATGKRVPFIRWGYGLSAISRPMLAIFGWPLWILTARSMDRLGKGLRTGARDAMLADASTPEIRGKVFGFHRSMDTLGAVFGPTLALVFLHFFPNGYRTMIFWALVPGLGALALTFLLRDTPTAPRPNIRPRDVFKGFLSYWGQASPQYRRVAGGLLAFTLFNAADTFLLFFMKERGYPDTTIIGLYIGFNIMYVLLAAPLGTLADRIGFRPTLAVGLLLFAIAYLGISWGDNLVFVIAAWATYGAYYAATDGIAKAWISTLCHPDDKATAIGTFSAWQSLASLTAGIWTGALWSLIGPQQVLTVSAAGAAIAGLYFALRKF